MANPISESHPASRTPAAGLPAWSPWARYLNAALGAWLFISAFLWLHSPASKSNTLIVGALIVIAALSAVTASALRRVNTALAVWLLLATLVIQNASVATLWNNVIVAALVFVFSLVPNRGAGRA